MAQDPLQARSAVTADEAIVCVLEHERAAQAAIAAARAQALQEAEAARADARATAARAERRLRTVRAAFDEAARTRCAALDAAAALAAQPHVLTAAELAALSRAVQDLATELSGGDA